MVRMLGVAAVVWAGCGIGPVEKGERFEGPGGSAVVIGTPSVRDRRLLPTTVATQPAPTKRTTVRGRLDVLVPGAADGAKLSVMAGFAGCGISVEAVGSAVVRNGHAHVRLNAPLAADDIRQLFITLDRDGDGRCTAVDTMWSALLPTGQDDVDLTLDLDELEAGESWLCFSGSGEE